jgi:antitoxin HigA-1
MARRTTQKPSARVRSHPGSILSLEFMEPLELSARGLAEALGVPPNRVTQIAAGQRSMTADTAHRLARYFGTTPEFWMNLQTAHDLSKAAAEADYSAIVARPSA